MTRAERNQINEFKGRRCTQGPGTCAVPTCTGKWPMRRHDRLQVICGNLNSKVTLARPALAAPFGPLAASLPPAVGLPDGARRARQAGPRAASDAARPPSGYPGRPLEGPLPGNREWHGAFARVRRPTPGHRGASWCAYPHSTRTDGAGCHWQMPRGTQWRSIGLWVSTQELFLLACPR